MTRPLTTSARQPDACAAIDPLLSLHADGMASSDESRRVEAHLPVCASCRQSLLWMQATRRALAARPILPPPADLQARIARSIAAAAAVPVPIRPARVFSLRPALAAAASLTFVAAVAGYSLLHSHAPKVTPLPPKQTVVAVTPRPEPMLPHALPSTKPPVVKHHPPSEPMIADKTIDEQPEMPAPSPPPAVKPTLKPTANTAPSAKPRPRLILRKKPLLAPAQVAILPTPSPEEHHAPPVRTPDSNAPDKVATAHVPPAPNPANAAPAIPPQASAPVMTASNNTENHTRNADLLAPVREHVGQMHTASFTPVKLVKTASMTEEKFVMVPGVYSR